MPTPRRAPLLVLLVLVALPCLAGCRAPTRSGPGTTTLGSEPSTHRPPGSPGLLQGRLRGASREADGEVPAGTTVFDDDVPAVRHLDPDLLAALHAAAVDAGHDGVEIHVNSGWRSRSYQERLLAQAVATYGSRAEAARWVATPDTSPHVSGDAVDVGGAEARAWLSAYGARYGLCRIYRNEPWHFELRAGAADHGCPTAYADPTHDPRMQR